MCLLEHILRASFFRWTGWDQLNQNNAGIPPLDPPPHYNRLFPLITYIEEGGTIRVKMAFQGKCLEGAPEDISNFVFEKEKWHLAYQGTEGAGFKKKWYWRAGCVRIGHKLVCGSEAAFTTFFEHNAEIKAWFIQYVRVQRTYCSECRLFIYGNDAAEVHATSREHALVKNQRLSWYRGSFRDLFRGERSN